MTRPTFLDQKANDPRGGAVEVVLARVEPILQALDLQRELFDWLQRRRRRTVQKMRIWDPLDQEEYWSRVVERCLKEASTERAWPEDDQGRCTYLRIIRCQVAAEYHRLKKDRIWRETTQGFSPSFEDCGIDAAADALLPHSMRNDSVEDLAASRQLLWRVVEYVRGLSEAERAILLTRWGASKSDAMALSGKSANTIRKEALVEFRLMREQVLPKERWPVHGSFVAGWLFFQRRVRRLLSWRFQATASGVLGGAVLTAAFLIS